MTSNEIFDAVGETLELLIQHYPKDTKKWIIPFSGDPASISLIEILFDMLMSFPVDERKREVLIVNAQTGIDFPHLSIKMNRILSRIHQYADENFFPIKTHIIYPPVEKSFWVHILGYGYPPPRSLFQWCANKLKLSPIAHWLKEVLKNEEMVIVSASTEKTVIFQSHPDFPNAYLFSPMTDIENDDIQYLLENSTMSVWDETNQNVLHFYKQLESVFSNVPLQEVRDSRGICGNTLFDYTFACWCCPYKREHESLREYARNAKEGFWLSPLLRYRGLLLLLSQQNENRTGRENKQHSYYPRRKKNQNEMKDYNKNESETLTMETRRTLLSELTKIIAEIQKEYCISAVLIREEEIKKILSIWETEG